MSSERPRLAKVKRLGGVTLILLAAAFLRIYQIGGAPPGLTHDEADHALDAWGVVQGIYPIYFTVGNGREPLFDYATALLMSFLGPHYLAGRLTAVFFSLLLIAGSYAWTRRAFNHPTALLTAAGLAVSFWAVMTGRHALRTVTQPTLFVLAVSCWFLAIHYATTSARRRWLILAAGILLGSSFYTYFPARLMWLLLPLGLFFMALFRPAGFQRAWRPTASVLLLAAAISAPLFIFLSQNPGAEVRLDQLSDPWRQAQRGDFDLLLANTAAGLRLLTIEGDAAWRYNLPGRPFLSWLLVPFFYLGLFVVLWQMVARRSLAAFLALAWLLLGWLPALITGPELSATRLSGLQPILFLFPALGLSLFARLIRLPRQSQTPLAAVLFGLIGLGTAHAYFNIWNNHPEVRVHYETTLVKGIDYLNKHGDGPTAISTTTPGYFHSPAVAQAALRRDDLQLRWFNGQGSLLLPAGAPTATLLFSGFAAPDPHLTPYLAGRLSRETIPLRPDDLNRPLWVDWMDSAAMEAAWRQTMETEIVAPDLSLPANFGQHALFLGYQIQTPAAGPGDEFRLVALWQIARPLPDAMLFSQLIGADGRPAAQADRLDAPGESWIAGDLFLQLHRFRLPEDLPAGQYPLIIGLYTRHDQQRLPILLEGEAVADHLHLISHTIHEAEGND